MRTLTRHGVESIMRLGEHDRKVESAQTVVRSKEEILLGALIKQQDSRPEKEEANQLHNLKTTAWEWAISTARANGRMKDLRAAHDKSEGILPPETIVNSPEFKRYRQLVETYERDYQELRSRGFEPFSEPPQS